MIMVSVLLYIGQRIVLKEGRIMKKGMTIIMAAFFLVLAFGGSSQALINGQVWPGLSSYANNPGSAFPTPPAIPASNVPYAEFSVAAINFVANSTASYNTFLGLTNADYTNVQGGFLGSNTIATSGGFNGTFFRFTGQMFLNTNSTFSILHDDGFAIQILDGNTPVYFLDKSTPVAATLDVFTPALATGTYNFVLAYGATNSFPEVLTMNVTNVPEPTTMLLLGLGMLGVAVLRRK